MAIMKIQTGQRRKIQDQAEVVTSAICSISFASFFIPSQYAIGLTAQNAWMAVNAAICLVSISLYLANCKFNKRWLLIAAFYCSYFVISNLAYGENLVVYGSLYRVIEGIGFASLCEYLLSKSYKLALRSFIVGASIMCALHIMSFIIYKDVVGGMAHGVIEYNIGRVHETQQNWYFLTYDNNSFFYILPLVCSVFLFGQLYDKRLEKMGIILLVVLVFVYIYHFSAAAFVSLVVFIALMFLGELFGVPKKRKLLKITVSIGFAFTAFVVLFINSDAMSTVAILLGKSVNLGGRDVIWANSIAVIRDNLLFGVGQEDVATTYLRIRMSHCHNILLELLYEGGIVAFLLYIAALFSFEKQDSHQSYNYCSWILIVGILTYFVAAGFDWFARNPLILIVFYLLCYMPQNDCAIEEIPHSSLRVC